MIRLYPTATKATHARLCVIDTALVSRKASDSRENRRHREIHTFHEGITTEQGRLHSFSRIALCMIALRACGYRVPKGSGHHKRGIDSLRYTLGSHWAQTADHLERCTRLRSQGMYERIGIVSDQDAQDLIDSTRQLRTDVIKWLKNQHAKLVPPGI